MLLEKSIQYHDPHNQWPVFSGKLDFQQLQPEKTEQGHRTVIIDRVNDYFKFTQTTINEVTVREVNNGECRHWLNGSDNLTLEETDLYRLSCERSRMYKDYYTYLYGLPMKLRDPGTLIDPIVNEDVFNGKACYTFRVFYEASVGEDIWDFFFDKETYALIGYRFFHDVSKNDGEYITLHGEEEIGGIKMPKNRFWYYNNNDKFLGADLLLPDLKKESSSLTVADYRRAKSLEYDSLINDEVFNLQVTPHYFTDSTGFWYTLFNKNGKTYHKYLFRNNTPELFFDHQKVAENLTAVIKDTFLANDLPLGNLQYKNADTLTFNIAGQEYFLDLHSYHIDTLQKEQPEHPLESISPDGRWKAYVKDYNLYMEDLESGDKIPLSTDGKEDYTYASYYGWFDLMKGESGKREDRFAVEWSPDSKYLLTRICDTRFAEKMYMLDYSQDTLFRPVLYGYFRGSPGDTTMVHYIPVIYNMTSLKAVDHDLPRYTHINTIGFDWSDKEGQIYARIPHRGYKKEEIKKLNLKTGTSELLFDETSGTNIDDMRVWYREDLRRIFFTSDRSGWRHLYSYQLDDKIITPVTSGAYVVNDIERIDTTNEVIYFSASGKEEGVNPYLYQLYRVNIDGTDLIRLTPENAHHSVSISPGGKYFLDNISSVGNPTKTVVRNTMDGSVEQVISRADISGLLDKAWVPPHTFEAVGRDGVTKIYGAMWKPTDFNPHQKYPVIDHSYTGPHTNMYPRAFRTALARNNQALAELGFIVIQIDGMGTYGRSKAFHDVSYKNMGKNLEDHVLAIHQLSERYPWLDTTRVGIFGHSAGGYDAGHALLAYPDFYKVGVASSADHDFRMEKAWWPEMYMGWPVDSTYHQVSNITMAGNLKGKLLLVHGGMDDNVNASATFKLAEALVKADKEFDLLILPSQRHGYRGKHRDYFRKKRWNYFVEHLLGQNPLWNY